MPDDLRETLKLLLIEELPLRVTLEEFPSEMPLFGPDSLNLDSIDALQISVLLEKHYGIKLASAEVAKEAFVSINSLHDFIVANRKS